MPWRVSGKRKSSGHRRFVDFPKKSQAKKFQKRLQKAEPKGSPHSYRTRITKIKKMKQPWD